MILILIFILVFLSSHMSFQKSQLYQVKFTLKTFQAQCKRTSCKVSATIKIDEQQKSFKDVADMKKNIALFNSQLSWDVLSLQYDELSGSYAEKIAIVSLHYETIEIGGRLNKIKVGHVTVNLAKLLNSNAYRIQNYYPVEKCFDKEAKLKLSVDFTQIQNRQNIIQMNNFKISTDFKTSKIKERMVEDQRNILQEKVYEYEDRLEKYRDSHGHQVKKLQEQIEKKDEKLQQIIIQNNSLVSAVQSHQLNIEKNKNKIQKMDKENLELKDQVRVMTNAKEQFQNKVFQLERDKKTVEDKLEQQERAKQNKQKYFKQQIQKYNNKYIESQNTRNKIIFELETKLKLELQKKDLYYQQIIKGLQSKKSETSHTSKQIIRKREIEISELTESIEEYNKVKQKQNKEIQFLNNEVLMKNQNVDAMLKELEGCKKAINGYIYQLQQAHFSNQTLQKNIQELKSSKISLRKELQQTKYELQLAKGTIQDNSNKIAKYTKELQIFRERQYYIEERYQNELEAKSYNEQCIIQTNQNYKSNISKLTMQCKLLKEMVDDLEEVVEELQKDKKSLQDKLYRQHNAKFEEQQEIIVLQNQIMKYKKMVQSMENNSKSAVNLRNLGNKADERNIYSHYSIQSNATFHPQLYKFQQS